MIRREKNRRAPPADLLVCFPTRSNLTLMPKPKPKAICGPAKQSSFTNGRGYGRGRVTRNNSMILSKNKQVHSDVCEPSSPKVTCKQVHSDVSEPTSPKVTCAGQIKVKPKGGRSCKNWQSVMEEIEKLHNSNKKKNNSNNKIKKPNWGETFGFLTCLRTLRFDFRCFGSFPTTVISSSDDEDEDEDEDEDDHDKKDTDYVQKRDQVDKDNGSSETVFSKWFMVLQEEQNAKERSTRSTYSSCVNDDNNFSEVVPPSNALLLMRCRSAPAKSWLEEEEDDEEKEKKLAKKVIEEEIELNKKKKLEQDETVLMRYETDFYQILSSDIAKETWVIGENNKDQMSRSRSCKRC